MADGVGHAAVAEQICRPDRRFHSGCRRLGQDGVQPRPGSGHVPDLDRPGSKLRGEGGHCLSLRSAAWSADTENDVLAVVSGGSRRRISASDSRVRSERLGYDDAIAGNVPER